MRQIKSNQEKPIDLVKDFYDQDIDHKALEKALTQRKNTAKGFTNFSLDTYTGEFGDAEKKHLLNRTMVGYCHRHHKDLDGLDLEQSINLILKEDKSISEPTNIYYWEMNADEYKQRYISEDVGPNESFINRPYSNELPPGSQEEFGSERNMAMHWVYIGDMLNQNTSIHWRLFIFLHNLCPTKSFDTHGHKGAFNYFYLLFNSCFSSYKDFIYNLTTDPSMLSFLNLQLSLKETPDENYAREVQELFTVGKRPFAKFTEKDVREVARALVGWSHGDFQYTAGFKDSPVFRDWNHDTGDKYFSSFYGNKIIRGKEGQDGAIELQEVVDMLCGIDEHSIYIVRRLYQFFVYPALTDDIEEKIIKPLAIVYRENNYSLIEPLKILLKSKHFYLNQIENSLIKSPTELTIGLLKETNLVNDGVLAQGDGTQEFLSIFEPNYFNGEQLDLSSWKYSLVGLLHFYYGNDIGMGISNPPSVSGWPAYYQEPVYDLFWINSSTLPRRIYASRDFLRWGVWNKGFQRRFNLVNYLKTFDNPKDIDLLIDELIFRFIGQNPSDNTLQKINQALLNDINEDHWADEVSKIIDQEIPDRSSYDSIYWRLGNAFEVLLLTGEFQLF